MWHVGNVTGRHAIYTFIQCTPLLVERAGVAPDMTFRIPACKQEKKECRQDIHSGFEIHEEGHTKSKTGAISGSTKWTLVQTKNLKKTKKNSGFPHHIFDLAFSQYVCMLIRGSQRLNNRTTQLKVC